MHEVNSSVSPNASMRKPSSGGIGGHFMSSKTVTDRAKTYSTNPFGTRRKRREAVKKMIRTLTALIEAERQSMDRVPANLRGS